MITNHVAINKNQKTSTKVTMSGKLVQIHSKLNANSIINRGRLNLNQAGKRSMRTNTLGRRNSNKWRSTEERRKEKKPKLTNMLAYKYARHDTRPHKAGQEI